MKNLSTKDNSLDNILINMNGKIKNNAGQKANKIILGALIISIAIHTIIVSFKRGE